jgi:hypothetical protein
MKAHTWNPVVVAALALPLVWLGCDGKTKETRREPPGQASDAAPKGGIDRKNPRVVAEAVVKAIRSGDGPGLMALCNATNKKKITPERLPLALSSLQKKVGAAETIGELRERPGGKGDVCAFLRQEGVETYVVTLTTEEGEYGFEDINSPDNADWEKFPLLK